VQLVQVDRAKRLDEIEKFMKPMADEALAYFARCNEIEYDVEADAEAPWADADLSQPENWPLVSFKMRAFAYSGIGSGACFKACFDSKTFRFVPDDESSVEVTDDDGDLSEDDVSL